MTTKKTTKIYIYFKILKITNAQIIFNYNFHLTLKQDFNNYMYSLLYIKLGLNLLIFIL